MKAQEDGKSASFWLEEQILDKLYPESLRRRNVAYVPRKPQPDGGL